MNRIPLTTQRRKSYTTNPSQYLPATVSPQSHKFSCYRKLATDRDARDLVLNEPLPQSSARPLLAMRIAVQRHSCCAETQRRLRSASVRLHSHLLERVDVPTHQRPRWHRPHLEQNRQRRQALSRVRHEHIDGPDVRLEQQLVGVDRRVDVTAADVLQTRRAGDLQRPRCVRQAVPMWVLCFGSSKKSAERISEEL